MISVQLQRSPGGMVYQNWVHLGKFNKQTIYKDVGSFQKNHPRIVQTSKANEGIEGVWRQHLQARREKRRSGPRAQSKQQAFESGVAPRSHDLWKNILAPPRQPGRKQAQGMGLFCLSDLLCQYPVGKAQLEAEGQGTL